MHVATQQAAFLSTHACFVSTMFAIFLISCEQEVIAQKASEQLRNSNPVEFNDFEIQGQCWDAADRNRTVPDVTLTLFALIGVDGRSEKIAETTSDEDGAFRFENLKPASEQRLENRKYVILAQRRNGPASFGFVWGSAQDQEQRILVGQKTGALRGKVVDEDGNPVRDVKIDQLAPLGQSVASLPVTRSNQQGLYFLSGLPTTPETRAFSLMLTHPDFPKTFVTVKKSPDILTLKMSKGCVVTGSVRDESSDEPLADVVVTAVPVSSELNEIHTRTDEEGNYRFVLKPGTYSVLLEADETHVAPALRNLSCAKGKTLDLGPMMALPGGWITGQVTNTDTGKPMEFNESGERLALGYYGPNRPAGKILHTHRLCSVDDEGRFRMRAAAGRNFPYLCNTRGERNVWSTKKFPAVIVKPGEETDVVMNVTPERTPDQKMDRAREVFASLPRPVDERVDAIIEEFRKLNHTVDETEVWCLLMQELVKIGKPAVLPLCEEFETTDEQRMMRRLGFALRAIDDPRAIPTLIRVLPKTLQPPMSDYGLLVADADLMAFMSKHDISDRDGGHFSFGRPVREVHAALVKLTKRNVDGRAIATTKKSEDPRGLAAAEKLYYETAARWADWWEKNWQKFDVDESFNKVNLPAYSAPDLSQLPKGLELTENSKIGDRFSGFVLTPIGDGDPGATYFMDLDTKRTFKWPEKLLQATDEKALQAVMQWAKEQGADLMCVAEPTENGELTSTLSLIDTQAWEIDKTSAEKIEQLVSNGALPTGRKVKKLLQHEFAADQPMRTDIGSSFLYLTNEQGLGLITVTDLVTEARDITGAFSAPKGVGFHRGVRFDVTTILR